MILIIQRNSQTFIELFNGEGLRTSALTRYNVKSQQILNENMFIVIFEGEYASKVILNKWCSPQETPSFSNLQSVLDYIDKEIKKQRVKNDELLESFTNHFSQNPTKQKIRQLTTTVKSLNKI